MRFQYLILFFNIFSTANMLHSQGIQDDKLYEFQYHAIYKLSFYGDSTNKTNVATEYFDLYMNDSLSLFLPSKFLRMDSAKRVERLAGNPFGPPIEWYMANATRNNLTIFKDLLNNTIITHEILSPQESEHYIYEEPEPLQWTIMSDTITINEQICQKAVLELGGRTWVAWFNPDVPIYDGPYKFSGLPGLVISVEDVSSSWRYELVQLKEVFQQFYFNCSDKRHVNTTKAEFLKRKRHLYDNRITIMKTQGHTFTDERKSKQDLDRDNNWIELR